MAERILGLDLGEVRIGLAISDPLKKIARGRGVYVRKSLAEDLDYLANLVKEEGISEVVLGLPHHMHGALGEQAQKILQFKELLAERIEIPIQLFDERLTTAEAERVLILADISRKKRKRVIDELSAVLILQGYLDQLNNRVC